MPTINRQTVITFPLNNNRADITTGIEAGSLYLNKILFEKQLNYGEAHCDRFEVTLFGVDDLTGETIQVYQLDYSVDPNTPTLHLLFYGVVDSCLKEENNANRKLVAYDLMYTIGNTDVTTWWNNYWNNRATSTVGALLTDLLSTFSITTVNSDVYDSPNINLEVMYFTGIQSITFGTVLSYICQILLCNPHFDNAGRLNFIFMGALWARRHSGIIIRNLYEDENSHFEGFETASVDRVVIYGETDVIAGEYGTGDNVYVIKNNPLLYNLVNVDYNTLAQTIYTDFSNGYAINYTPANIKMIVSDPDIEVGDIVQTTIDNTNVYSFISSIEMSGSLFVEQTLISVGNQLLTPDDFNITSAGIANANNTANEALDQANTTATHFVWVPNDGAYVTTDNTPAGQAPTQNYSKLTEDGLYVAVDGKEVAHFGVDANDKPIAILGDQTANGTSVTMSNTGIVASKQKNSSTNIDYLSLNVAPDVNYDLNYQATIGNSVSTNDGVRSVVLGDGNTITSDSETGVFVAGHNNSIDNDRYVDNYSGTCVLGRSNTVEGKISIVAGDSNHIYDNNGNGLHNYIIGASNTVTSSGYGAQYNSIVGRGNTITGDSMESVVLGQNNDVVGSNNCLLGYDLKDGANTLHNIIVGQYNVAPTTSDNFIIGNGSSSNQRSNAMVVNDGVTLYPQQRDALTFDNGGVDRAIHIRYKNDAGGTDAGIVKMIPTGTSFGVNLGIGGGGLTVVGGGESTTSIAEDPTLIGLTTTSENAVVCSDSNVNIVSNANTVANYKIMTFQTNGLLKINECSGTGNQLAYFNSTGQLNRDTVRKFYAKGDSFSGWRFNGLGGILTNSGQDMYIYVPAPYIPSLPSTSGLTLNMSVRHANGGYPYLYNKSTVISGIDLVTNGTKISGLYVVEFTDLSISGFTLHLSFHTTGSSSTQPLQKSASSTSTAITNNTPLGVFLNMSGTFST